MFQFVDVPKETLEANERHMRKLQDSIHEAQRACDSHRARLKELQEKNVAQSNEAFGKSLKNTSDIRDEYAKHKVELEKAYEECLLGVAACHKAYMSRMSIEFTERGKREQTRIKSIMDQIERDEREFELVMSKVSKIAAETTKARNREIVESKRAQEKRVDENRQVANLEASRFATSEKNQEATLETHTLNTIRELDHRMHSGSKECESLTSVLNKHKAEVAAAKNALQARAREVNETNSKLQEFSAAFKRDETALVEVRAGISAQEKALDQLRSAAAATTQTNKEKQNTIASLELQVTGLMQEMAPKQQQVKLLQKELILMNNVVETKRREQQQLDLALSQLRTKSKSLTAQLEGPRKLINDIQKRFINFHVEVARIAGSETLEGLLRNAISSDQELARAHAAALEERGAGAGKLSIADLCSIAALTCPSRLLRYVKLSLNRLALSASAAPKLSDTPHAIVKLQNETSTLQRQSTNLKSTLASEAHMHKCKITKLSFQNSELCTLLNDLRREQQLWHAMRAKSATIATST